MATTAKEKILKRIREALSNPVPLPFPHSEGTQSVYASTGDDPVISFAEEFTKLQGKFLFCADTGDLQKQLAEFIAAKGWTNICCREKDLIALLKNIQIAATDDLANCDASLTGCEFLVARTGSIVLSAAQEKGRTTSVYAPVHICIAYADQVVPDIKDALLSLKEKHVAGFPSFVSFASGPSRTADIEKTLVTGVHGPKEVYCFLTERIK